MQGPGLVWVWPFTLGVGTESFQEKRAMWGGTTPLPRETALAQPGMSGLVKEPLRSPPLCLPPRSLIFPLPSAQ